MPDNALTITITGNSKSAEEAFKRLATAMESAAKGIKGLDAEQAKAEKTTTSLSAAEKKQGEVAETASKKAAKAMKRQEQATTAMLRQMEGLRGIGLGLTAVFAGMAGGMIAIGKAGVEMNMVLQRAQLAFTSITGSADKARTFIAQINKEAMTSTITFRGMLPIAQQLAAAYGPDGLGKVLPTIRAFGDARVLLGVSIDAQQRALIGFRHLLTTGVNERALKEIDFNLPGVGVHNILEQQFGTADSKALKAAGVSGEQIADAIVAGMRTRFGGAQAKLASKDLESVLTNFKDAFGRMSAAVTSDFAPKVVAALGTLLRSLNGLVTDKSAIEALKAPFDALGDTIKAVGDAGAKIIDWFEHLSTGGKKAAVEIGELVGGLVGIAGPTLLATSAVASLILKFREFAKARAEVEAVEGALGAEGAAAGVGLIGLLGTAALAVGTFIAAWKFGQIIDDMTGLSDKISDVIVKMAGIKPPPVDENGDAASTGGDFAAVQMARRVAFDAQKRKEKTVGSAFLRETGGLADPTDLFQLKAESAKLFGTEELPTLTPEQLHQIAGTISLQANDLRSRQLRNRPHKPGTLPPAGSKPKLKPAAIDDDALKMMQEAQVGAISDDEKREVAKTQLDYKNKRRDALETIKDKKAANRTIADLTVAEERDVQAIRDRYADERQKKAEAEWTQEQKLHAQKNDAIRKSVKEQEDLWRRAMDARAKAQGKDRDAIGLQYNQRIADLVQERGNKIAALPPGLTAQDRSNAVKSITGAIAVDKGTAGIERDKALADLDKKEYDDRIKALDEIAQKRAEIALQQAQATGDAKVELAVIKDQVAEIDKQKARLGAGLEDTKTGLDLDARRLDLLQQAQSIKDDEEQKQQKIDDLNDKLIRESLPSEVQAQREILDLMSKQTREGARPDLALDAAAQQMREKLGLAPADNVVVKSSWATFWGNLGKQAVGSAKGIGESFFEGILSGQASFKNSWKKLFADLKSLAIAGLSKVLVEGLSSQIGGLFSHSGIGSSIASLFGFGGAGRSPAKVAIDTDKAGASVDNFTTTLNQGAKKTSESLLLFGASLAAALAGLGGSGGGKHHGGLLGAIIGGGLALLTGGASLAVGAAIGGGLGAAADHGSLLQGAMGGYGLANVASGLGVGATGASATTLSSGVIGQSARSFDGGIAGAGAGHTITINQHIGTIHSQADLQESYSDLARMVRRSLRTA